MEQEDMPELVTFEITKLNVPSTQRKGKIMFFNRHLINVKISTVVLFL